MNPSTTTVDSIKVGSQPNGIAVSPDGQKLYVTLRYTDKLAVVELAAPDGVADADRRGRFAARGRLEQARDAGVCDELRRHRDGG